jgi:hypothetical protein
MSFWRIFWYIVALVAVAYIVQSVIRTRDFSRSDAWAALAIIVAILLAQTATSQTPTQTGPGPATGRTTSKSTGPDVPPIESVDYWYNTRYRTDCRGIAAQAFVVDVRDRGGTSDGYGIYVQQVDSGDLNGDGEPEAAVLLQCHPSMANFVVQEVQVFTGSTGGPQQLGELPKPPPVPRGHPTLSPVFRSEEFYIRFGQLVTGVDYYSSTDSHAGGPSIYRRITWLWHGRRFVVWKVENR